jgi:hypothetical protein
MSLLDNIKYVFQIPLEWFRRVGAFCFDSYGGHLIKITRQKDGSAAFDVDENELAQIIPVVPSADVGTPVDGKDYPNALDTSGGTWSWTSGGANGLVLDCYCLIAPQASGSNYSVFQRARLSFSKDGLLVSGQLLSDRIRIQAKNA